MTARDASTTDDRTNWFIALINVRQTPTQAALVCAQDAFHKKFYADLSREEFDRRIVAKLAPVEAGEIRVTNPDLHELGCSDLPRTVSVLEIFRAERRENLAGRGRYVALLRATQR
jgi:hypothetical protein